MTDPNPPEELERRAEEANVAYERNTAFRTLVVAIPVIGSSLDMVFASEGQRIFRERIRKQIAAMKDDIQERMEAVEDSVIDKEYLESEEFFDLVIRAFDATIKTRDEEKRRMYARILTESTILSKREGHSPEDYLNLIADLTPRELAVARALYRDGPREGNRNLWAGEAEDVWMEYLDKVCAEVGIDRADLQLILGRLHTSGLITQVLNTVSGLPSLDRLPVYWVAPTFEKLMRFLERRGQALED